MMDPQLTPPDPATQASADLSQAAVPKRDSLAGLISKLATPEGREEAVMQIAAKRLTNDPVLLERAIQTFVSRGWACDAAALAKEQGDTARAAEILRSSLSRTDLPRPARDPVHFQLAKLERELGNFGEAVAQLEAGRYYRDAARLAGEHGMSADAARLLQLVPNEPPRSFAEAIGRQSRRTSSVDRAPTRAVEDVVSDLDGELTFRDLSSSTPRDKLDRVTREAYIGAAREAARRLSAGDTAGAEAAYQKAGLLPASAFVAIEQGRAADALDALVASPDGFHALGARLAERLGKRDTAIDLWRKAGRFDLAARMLEKAGDLSGALECYEAGADQKFPRPGADSPIDVSALLWYGSRNNEPSWARGESAWRSNLERAAELAGKLGLADRAADLLERAITTAKRDIGGERMAVTIEGAARAAESLGRVEEAVDLLEMDRRYSKAAKLALRYGLTERASLSLEKAGELESATKLTSDPSRQAVYTALALVLRDD